MYHLPGVTEYLTKLKKIILKCGSKSNTNLFVIRPFLTDLAKEMKQGEKKQNGATDEKI